MQEDTPTLDALGTVKVEQYPEESDSKDQSQDAHNMPGVMATRYSLCSTEENVGPVMTPIVLTTNTDTLTTVMMAKEAALPMMFTQ